MRGSEASPWPQGFGHRLKHAGSSVPRQDFEFLEGNVRGELSDNIFLALISGEEKAHAT